MWDERICTVNAEDFLAVSCPAKDVGEGAYL